MVKQINTRGRTQEEKDLVIQHASDLLVIASFDGYFRWVSPSFTKVLGRDKEELLTRPFTDFVHPDDREAGLRQLEALKAGRESAGFEHRYIRKDGTIRWIAWNAHPVVDKIGRAHV
jgi:PAS domain S-box-containing protein